MTYIKWKDEVEGYLVSLPQEEKQKIFSYFSEMYADKRDAGKSEAQIIEEFGAPYDVAKRILADSKDAPSPQGAAQHGVNGGNNYNYNYYNYNYGAAPQPENYRQSATKQAEPQQPAQEPLPNGIPSEYIAKPQPAKNSSGRTVAYVTLTFLAVVLAICLVFSSVAVLADGFANIAAAIGAMVAGYANTAVGAAEAGLGVI